MKIWTIIIFFYYWILALIIKLFSVDLNKIVSENVFNANKSLELEVLLLLKCFISLAWQCVCVLFGKSKSGLTTYF